MVSSIWHLPFFVLQKGFETSDMDLNYAWQRMQSSYIQMDYKHVH